MALSKAGNAEKIYVNEIIRITYKCNWTCKFCNVIKTNNYGEHDVSSKEVTYKILHLAKKYTLEERKRLVLSFSGGEPTLDKHLLNYIKLAKKIGVGIVEIQTNGTTLFKNKELLWDLLDAGLNEIFLAQHSSNKDVNKKLGSFFKSEDFIEWTQYVLENKLHKKLAIYLNIVITKINIFSLYDYLKFLVDIGFVDIIPTRSHSDGRVTRKVSFGFVQPNGYAQLNKEEVLLTYIDEEVKEVERVVHFCRDNKILPDFHFVCPPLCILNYPEYNLELERLKKLEKDNASGDVNEGNLKSYEIIFKEKEKFEDCGKCKYDKYCLGFYKNWLDYVGREYAKEKVNSFIEKK